MATKSEQKLKEESWERKFAASADLQFEFGDVEAYVAFKRAESQGRIRGLKSSVVPASPAGTGSGGVDEESLKKEFAESADLQAEFAGDVTSYVEFKKAEAAGRAKMCSGGVVAFSSAPAPAPAPKTEKKNPGKVFHISKKVRDVFAEAADRAGMVQRDEQRQYDEGMACGTDGVPIES